MQVSSVGIQFCHLLGNGFNNFGMTMTHYNMMSSIHRAVIVVSTVITWKKKQAPEKLMI